MSVFSSIFYGDSQVFVPVNTSFPHCLFYFVRESLKEFFFQVWKCMLHIFTRVIVTKDFPRLSHRVNLKDLEPLYKIQGENVENVFVFVFVFVTRIYLHQVWCGHYRTVMVQTNRWVGTLLIGSRWCHQRRDGVQQREVEVSLRFGFEL